MHADVSVHSAAVDADESWGAIGSLSVMVAALPAQEELIFCFHSCAQARPHCACQQHSDPNFSRGYLYSVVVV